MGRGAALLARPGRLAGESLARATAAWAAEEEFPFLFGSDAGLALIDAGKHFDAIISDLMMPEMSGMEFYDELARRAPELTERVVFISGGAFTQKASAFLERTSNQLVDKPFDPDTVRALVQRLLA